MGWMGRDNIIHRLVIYIVKRELSGPLESSLDGRRRRGNWLFWGVLTEAGIGFLWRKWEDTEQLYREL